MIERIVHLGFEVRVELTRSDGQSGLGAGDLRDRCEELELAEGQIVYLRPSRERVFDSARRSLLECSTRSARRSARGRRACSRARSRRPRAPPRRRCS